MQQPAPEPAAAHLVVRHPDTGWWSRLGGTKDNTNAGGGGGETAEAMAAAHQYFTFLYWQAEHLLRRLLALDDRHPEPMKRAACDIAHAHRMLATHHLNGICTPASAAASPLPAAFEEWTADPLPPATHRYLQQQQPESSQSPYLVSVAWLRCSLLHMHCIQDRVDADTMATMHRWLERMEQMRRFLWHRVEPQLVRDAAPQRRQQLFTVVAADNNSSDDDNDNDTYSDDNDDDESVAIAAAAQQRVGSSSSSNSTSPPTRCHMCDIWRPTKQS